jgi:uncharacterized membrane protein YozB (DUF420 family)
MNIYLERRVFEKMNPSLITLLIYILGLLPLMLLGFYFARRKMFTQHKLTMTTILIANWLLIFWVMSPTYRAILASDPAPNFSTLPVIVPTIHMALGTLAQLMATYLVILMWTERTPLEKLVPFRIKNIKTPMRFTLGLWIATVLLGFGIYAINNLGSSPDTGTDNLPASTEEATVESPETTEEAEAPATTEEP